VDRGSVSENDNAREREANEANNQLNEGLQSCRAVVSNYRALLDKKRRQTPTKDKRDDGEHRS
jgi:hypothetical protein